MGNQHHTAGGGNRFINILFTTSNTKNLAVGATPTPTAFVVDELLTFNYYMMLMLPGFIDK